MKSPSNYVSNIVTRASLARSSNAHNHIKDAVILVDCTGTEFFKMSVTASLLRLQCASAVYEHLFFLVCSQTPMQMW